jgi:hypothetical protein
MKNLLWSLDIGASLLCLIAGWMSPWPTCMLFFGLSMVLSGRKRASE